MKIDIRKYPSPIGEITVYRIINNTGAYVELSSLGAGILSVNVPDRYGKIDNVALSYASPADYINDGPCMGKTPGRYANRIAKGHLEIDGNEYMLEINNGINHLHGGTNGFQNQIWGSELLPDGIRFIYRSQDGEANYPGTLVAMVEYRWNDRNQLDITFKATTDAPTVVNLTNHAYWNLNGADSGSVLDQELRINASKYLVTDEDIVTLPDLANVEGTPLDFRNTEKIGKRIRDAFPMMRWAKGYDFCWAIDDNSEPAVVLRASESGRTLTITTDQPGVQVYTGNWLAGCPLNRSGKCYLDYDGVAIEAQGFPNAPNIPGFPSQLLRPGQEYIRHIRYSFSIK